MISKTKRNCKNCGKEFEIKTSDIKAGLKRGMKGIGTCCSRKCVNENHSKDKGAFFNCSQCGKETYKFYSYLKKRNNKHIFCSNECCGKFNKQDFILINCRTCGKEFYKRPIEIKRRNTNNHFCSNKCTTKYLKIINQSKSGNKRSKLEIYLEKMIRIDFPDLELITNDRKTIYMELDLYFPSLNFAIEINGIVHYKPIYGKETLEKTKLKDRRKKKMCKRKLIDLKILKVNRKPSEKNSIYYYNKIKKLILKKIRKPE